jgi:hypothetical protein
MQSRNIYQNKWPWIGYYTEKIEVLIEKFIFALLFILIIKINLIYKQHGKLDCKSYGQYQLTFVSC